MLSKILLTCTHRGLVERLRWFQPFSSLPAQLHQAAIPCVQLWNVDGVSIAIARFPPEPYGRMAGTTVFADLVRAN